MVNVCVILLTGDAAVLALIGTCICLLKYENEGIDKALQKLRWHLHVALRRHSHDIVKLFI